MRRTVSRDPHSVSPFVPVVSLYGDPGSDPLLDPGVPMDRALVVGRRYEPRGREVVTSRVDAHLVRVGVGGDVPVTHPAGHTVPCEVDCDVRDGRCGRRRKAPVSHPERGRSFPRRLGTRGGRLLPLWTDPGVGCARQDECLVRTGARVGNLLPSSLVGCGVTSRVLVEGPEDV